MTNAYVTNSGTSFSTPEVSGAAALMLSYCPGLTPAQIKEIFMTTANQEKGKLLEMNRSGGRLDVKAAFEYLKEKAVFPETSSETISEDNVYNCQVRDPDEEDECEEKIRTCNEISSHTQQSCESNRGVWVDNTDIDKLAPDPYCICSSSCEESFSWGDYSCSLRNFDTNQNLYKNNLNMLMLLAISGFVLFIVGAIRSNCKSRNKNLD